MKICFIGEVRRIYAEALASSGETITQVSDTFLTDVGRALADKIGPRIEPKSAVGLPNAMPIISAVTGVTLLPVVKSFLSCMRHNSLLVNWKCHTLS